MELNRPPAGRIIGMTSNMMHRIMSKKFAGEAYGPSETACLSFICYKHNFEPEVPVFQRDIEKEFNLRSPSASETIKNLEKKGLLYKENIEGDGRKKRLLPTQKGLEYDTKIKSKLHEVEEILVKNITPENLEIYWQVSKQMIDNLKMEEING